MQLRIAGIIKESIVDGPGIRLVVFTQGCRHHCVGCHNPETHSFDSGSFMETDEIIQLVKKNPLLDGITLSGGDPFEQAEACAELAAKVKELGLNVITYTGYTFEDLVKGFSRKTGWKELIRTTDLLVDGRFDIEKKNLLLKFKGSENQRIIDVHESLSCGRAVECVL